MYEIVGKEIVNDLVQKMVIKAPFVARKCQPGQFIIIIPREGGERIPLTITDFDREKGFVTIIYQMLGESTRYLGTLNVGDTVPDFVGPLGVPTHLEKHKRVLGIGGGVGAAPLYPQMKALAENGVEIDIIIGGRSKEFCILGDDFKVFSRNLYYATNDGSLGEKGFVTDVLNRLIAEGEEYDEVFAIGPLIMMKAVVAITKKLNIPTSVSLNPLMIDGTGMCGCCRVTVGGETKFACVDGPDFDGFLVDFDEAMVRQTYYRDEEQKSHRCNLDQYK